MVRRATRVGSKDNTLIIEMRPDECRSDGDTPFDYGWARHRLSEGGHSIRFLINH